MAAGVLRAAHERELTVPRDLSVVGFDDADLATILSPGLTTVRQPLAELGLDRSEPAYAHARAAARGDAARRARHEARRP